MRDRTKNRMPSRMVPAEYVEVVGIGIDGWIAQSRGYGDGERSARRNAIAVYVKIPDDDTGDSHDHRIETQPFVHSGALDAIGIGTEGAPLLPTFYDTSPRHSPT